MLPPTRFFNIFQYTLREFWRSSPRKNVWAFYYNYMMVDSFALGRDKMMCVILGTIRYVNSVILPYAVKFLGRQNAIIYQSQLIVLPRLLSLCPSFISLTLKVISVNLNPYAHKWSLILYDFILLTLNPQSEQVWWIRHLSVIQKCNWSKPSEVK